MIQVSKQVSNASVSLGTFDAADFTTKRKVVPVVVPTISGWGWNSPLRLWSRVTMSQLWGHKRCIEAGICWQRFPGCWMMMRNNVGASWNGATPVIQTLVAFSLINHPAIAVPPFILVGAACGRVWYSKLPRGEKHGPSLLIWLHAAQQHEAYSKTYTGTWSISMFHSPPVRWASRSDTRQNPDRMPAQLAERSCKMSDRFPDRNFKYSKVEWLNAR